MFLVSSSIAFRGFMQVLNLENLGYQHILEMFQIAVEITFGFALGKMLFNPQFGNTL